MAADIGFGIAFERIVGAGPTYATVGELKALQVPELTTDEVETTHFASPDGVKEFIPGLKTVGNPEFTIQFADINDLDTIIEDWKSKAIVSYRINWKDATNWDFTGFITSVKQDTPMENPLLATVSIRIPTRPTFLV